MKVSDLIGRLQTMPPDAEVWAVWDGAARTNVESVWLARSGAVMLCEPEQTVYDDEDRPADAPLEKDDPYWSVPLNPKGKEND